MPKLDKTGPLGQGPRTGRSLGGCCRNMRQGFRNCGRGIRFSRLLSSKDKLSMLEDEENLLEKELLAIREEKIALKNKQ